jgi:hypothetical protein
MIDDMEVFEQKIKDYLKLKAMRYVDSLSLTDKAKFEVYDEINMDLFGEHIITTPSWGEDASEESVERLVKKKQALNDRYEKIKHLGVNSAEIREYFKELSTLNLKLLLTPREQCLKCVGWGKSDEAEAYPHCMKGEDECLLYLHRETDNCPYQLKQ